MSAVLFGSTAAPEGTCIPEHTCKQACKRSLFRPCYLPSPHGVPALQRQHHRRCIQHRSTRRQSVHGSTAAAPVEASSSILDSAAEYVNIIESDGNIIRSHDLGSASKVAISRMTALCTPRHQEAALTALAKVKQIVLAKMCQLVKHAILIHLSCVFLQNNGSSNKEGAFLLLVQMLLGPQTSPSPILAADFLQAFLTGPDGCVRQVGDMHSSPKWRSLAAQLSPVTPGKLLQLISVTPHLEVCLHDHPEASADVMLCIAHQLSHKPE